MKARGKKIKPIRDTLYGGDLLKCAAELDSGSLGGDFEVKFIRTVKGGADYAAAASKFNISYEMAQYTVRRLLKRYRAMADLHKGLKVLVDRDDDLTAIGLTQTQREALQMLLTGKSQAAVAGRLGITQAAVSSRLRLASKFLDSMAPVHEWVTPLAKAVTVRRKRNTLTSFQRKSKNG